MISHYYKFLIVALITATMPFEKLNAYTCTFKNNTTRSTIKVRFYRAAWVNSESQIFTLYPGEEASWNAGLWLVTGLKVVEMKYFPSGKIIPGGGTEVPGIDKINERWKGKGRAVSQTWEMFEAKFPIDEHRSNIQFTLNRLPAGPGGSTYPGGKVWESAKLEIIEGLQKVESVTATK